MITKRSTLLLVLAILGCLSLSQAASKNDKLKEEKEENRSKELVNNAAGFKTKNINKTIARVEAMLAKNPQLPRLTRGEIIALLDNITRTDELQKVNKGGNEDKRRREEKSLLVVLPFIPYNESSKAGMEELYTMEPMTKFVTEGTTPSGERMKSKNSDKNPDFLIDMSAASSSERAQVVESSIRFENPPSSSSTTNKIPVTTPTPTPHKRRRKPSSMKPIIVAPQEQRPVYVHKGKTSTSTQPPSDSEESSVEWRPYTAYDSPSVLTQRPSTVKLPLPDKSSSEEDPNIPKNHKPEGHQVFVTMPQLIMSSSSAPAYQTRSTTSQPVEIVTPRTVGTTKRPRKKPKTTTTRTTSKEVDDQEMFSGWKPAVGASFNKPEKKHKTTTTSTPMPMPDISVAAENLPADMKKILGSLGLMPGEADETQKYQSSMEKPTIPTSPIDFKPLNPVIDPSSYVSFKRIPDKVQNSNKGGGVMDNDMKQILASFGLMSESGNNYNRRGKLLEDDGAEGRMMGNSDSDEQEEGYEEVKKKPHTNFTLKDINTDALSDEMKDMLSDLGVLRGSNSKRRNGKGHIFNPVTQSALLENPEQAERISKVLIDIKKLSEDNKTHQLNPEEIRAHLYNITAAVLNSSEDEDKKLNANPGLNSISNGWNSQEAGNDEEIKFGGDQTFDGYEPDEEELLRIQNNHKFGSSDDIGSAPSSSFFPEKDDDDSVSTTRYLGIFNKSLQSMNGQPDPLSNEELHQQQDSYKNEVKRQQPDNSTSTTSETSLDTTSEASVTTSEAPESSSVEESSRSAESSSSTTEASTTTSEEPSPSSAEDSVPAEANEPTMTPSTTTADSSNIRDLEESFGGDTPTQRPNGLYFLLDWNSFLRVGQDNRTVNLSFSPKVGDPRNFIQVNVP